MRVLFALAVAFAACVGPRLPAQTFDETQTGRSFVIAFPDTVGNLADARFPSSLRDTFAVYIYSAGDNRCTITGFGGYRRELNLVAGAFAVVWLDDAANPSSDITVREVGRITRSTFRIEARDPVFVMCYMSTKFGSEMWVPHAIESLGRQYAVVTMLGSVIRDIHMFAPYEFSLQNRMGPARVLIAAAHDSTRVEIRRSRGFHRDSDTIVALDAGEAYQVEGHVDTLTHGWNEQTDLSGIHVVASAPVAVIAYNTRWKYDDGSSAPFGLVRNASSNLLVESLSPIEQHGTEFVALPAWDDRRTALDASGSRNGFRSVEISRVVAFDVANRIVALRDGSLTTLETIPWQEQIEIVERASRAVSIKSDKPAQAIHATGDVTYTNYSFPPDWAPVRYNYWSGFMTELVPREQWVSFAPIFTPSYPDSMEHFVNVVADLGASRRITWRSGQPFDFNRGQIAGTDLVWGSARLEAGTQDAITGGDGARFTGAIYGVRMGSEVYDPTKSPENAHYYETMALSYGYPLAPARRRLREPTGARREPDDEQPLLSVVSDPARVIVRLRQSADVFLDILDMTGRSVATLHNDPLVEGTHVVRVDDPTLPAGMYLVRLVANGVVTIAPLAIVR